MKTKTFPIEAAKRELYEESGAVEYYIVPICDYWVGSDDETSGANGMVFKAIIHELGEIPDSEMAEVKQYFEDKTGKGLYQVCI